MSNKVILLFAMVAFIGCKKNEEKQEPEGNQAFAQLTEDYFKDKNALYPLDATQNGQNEYNGTLQFEMTDNFRRLQRRFFTKYNQGLAEIDETALTPEEKNSYEIIKWEIEIGTEMMNYPSNYMPFNQFWGTHLTIGQFAGGTSAQPFKTVEDYRNFLNRMELYGKWVDSAMIAMRTGINEKVVLPKSLVVKIIPQFEGLITAKVEDNLFYSSIKLMPSSFSASDKKDLSQKYAATISNQLVPRFKKMSEFLKNDYLPAARKTSGVGSFPFGKEFYATSAKRWTTTDMTPEEIHELGLKEVARLKNEMEAVKKQVGFKGTLKEFFEYVRNKKELKPFTKPEQVIANFEAIHERIKPNVDKLFSLQPKTAFKIRRTEAFREKSASAEYQQGMADGSRPGTFYVPIPDAANYNFYGDEDLFLHEAIPGHHFQVSLQQENKNLPDFRKFSWFGAYGEGWALYTESMGKELGLYKDPYQYFGMLSSEMHRAIRLVVDTGIHTKGWTREQAIQYSLDNEARSESSIISEIERYMAIPGQALSYKIGQLKILELRKKAQDKMGKNFDIKKFHEIILASGCMPLKLLENNIDNWINSK